jgi:hypothetical protein
MPEHRKRGSRRRSWNIEEEDYYDRTNAINLTVFDMYGNRLPKSFTSKLAEAVNDMAVKEGFGFSFTKS